MKLPKYQRGDVVIVDFLFSDRTGSKRRPALVVQDDFWNQTLDDTILGLISSSHRRMQAAAATQFFVPITPELSAETGLRADSVVQCEKPDDARSESDSLENWPPQ